MVNIEKRVQFQIERSGYLFLENTSAEKCSNSIIFTEKKRLCHTKIEKLQSYITLWVR